MINMQHWNAYSENAVEGLPYEGKILLQSPKNSWKGSMFRKQGSVSRQGFGVLPLPSTNGIVAE